MDPKLVDYSETSSSEEDKHTESKKIAIVQPVPQEQYAENPSETVPEPESEYQQTHEPTPSPHPSEPSDIPIDEIPEPEPEIILLSSDSDTVSFLTDTTLGK